MGASLQGIIGSGVLGGAGGGGGGAAFVAYITQVNLNFDSDTQEMVMTVYYNQTVDAIENVPTFGGVTLDSGISTVSDNIIEFRGGGPGAFDGELWTIPSDTAAIIFGGDIYHTRTMYGQGQAQYMRQPSESPVSIVDATIYQGDNGDGTCTLALFFSPNANPAIVTGEIMQPFACAGNAPQDIVGGNGTSYILVQLPGTLVGGESWSMQPSNRFNLSVGTLI